MTPTPQKSPREIAEELVVKQHGKLVCFCLDSFVCLKHQMIKEVEEAIQSERTAYNALLDKVQRIEAERDDLKKRVDSEYDRGIEDAKKVIDTAIEEAHRVIRTCRRDGDEINLDRWQERLRCLEGTAEAILKLRRVS